MMLFAQEPNAFLRAVELTFAVAPSKLEEAGSVLFAPQSEADFLVSEIARSLEGSNGADESRSHTRARR